MNIYIDFNQYDQQFMNFQNDDPLNNQQTLVNYDNLVHHSTQQNRNVQNNRKSFVYIK